MSLPPSVEESARRAGVVWVDLGDGPRVVWHVWHDGAIYVVCGGQEQQLPRAGTAETAVLVLRGKASAGDPVVECTAAVSRIEPGSESWLSVVPALHDARWNPPDGEAQPERWARESTVLRLEPLAG
ncbi:MAG: hypothetical protein JWM40_1447 [Frankiales bacterium]|nr:hypothetical protein [Frankiales bacterium]